MSYTDPQIGTLTISGDPARFVATERVPVSGVSMDFAPVQDLHGYEYPWPGGGGKNKFNVDFETKFINGSTVTNVGGGAVTVTETPTSSFDWVIGTTELPAGDYILSGCPANGGANKYRLQVTDYPVTNSLGQDNGSGVSFSLTETTSIAVRVQVYTGAPNYLIYYPMIRPATVTDATFAPYENICPISGRDSVTVYVSPEPLIVDGTEEHEIEFGQTVYEGALTINEDGSGQIVSTMSMVDLGTLTWNYDGRFYATLTQSEQTYQKQTQNAFCNRYKWSNVYNNGNGTFYISENHNLSIWDSSYTDTATFKAMLTANNAQLVYELAEPVTIQLDPIEITTLIGLNYVWTSDNNLITITFPYNKEVQPMALSYDHCWTYPKAYIDKLEARIAALETAAAEAKTTAAPAETRETVAEDITVTEEPETEPVTKKGGK